MVLPARIISGGPIALLPEITSATIANSWLVSFIAVI